AAPRGWLAAHHRFLAAGVVTMGEERMKARRSRIGSGPLAAGWVACTLLGSALPVSRSAAAPARPRRPAPSALAGAAPAYTEEQLEQARALRERCLVDDTGYELLRSLTGHVGPRFAGSPGDPRAVEWALERLRALGFQNVHAEPVTVPHWIR